MLDTSRERRKAIQVGLSSVTLGELAFGAAKSSRPKDARDALHEPNNLRLAF